MTSTSRPRTPSKTHFRATVSVYLTERGMSQSALALATGTNYVHTNHIMNGRRLPRPPWIDLVANALELQAEQREALHKAAALDHGFKLDLTKP